MLMRSDYLEWITRNYALVDYNLAASGIPSLAPDEVTSSPKAAAGSWRAACAALAGEHGVEANELIGCIGASQGIWLAYAAMLRPGDEVLIETPTYEPLVGTAMAAGATVRRFDRGPSKGFSLDIESVLGALSPRTRVVAITDLHNPSGARTDRTAIRAVADALAAQDGFLFVDEIYAAFDRTDGKGVRCRTARREAPNVVTVSSFSKAFGLGAERIGWVTGPPEIIEKAHIALRASTGDLPAAWARSVLTAIDAIPSLAARAERLRGTKGRRVEAWVAARPRLSWTGCGDGMYGLVQVDAGSDLRRAIEAGIAQHRVIVVPGVFFDIPDAFRIAWALPASRLDEGLRRLDCVLSDADLL